MMISGIDRYDIRRVMDHTRGNFRRVNVLHAMQTDCSICGYDTVADSGLDPTCLAEE
jgi:hypothetical protein